MISKVCGTQLAKLRIRREAGMVEAAHARMQILPAIMHFSPLPVSPPGDSPCAPHDRNGGKRALCFSWRNPVTPIRTLTESASKLGNEAKESVEELGRAAGRKLDEARDETGAALHTAASTVRKTGRQGSQAIDNLASGAADQLDATATYVEDHDLRDALTGLRRFGRRHLAGSLVAAAALGFFAGSALSRVAHSCGSKQEES